MPSVEFLRAEFQSFLAPGNDELFLRYLQEADTRLLERGRWRWCKARIELSPVSGIVTLPEGYASVLGVQMDGHATDIMDEEFEFIPDGVGDIPLNQLGTARLIDQGLDNTGLRFYKAVGLTDDDVTLTLLVLRSPALLYDPSNPDSDLPPEATDETRCPSAYALKLACFGVRYEEKHDISAGERYFERAYAVLEGQAQNQRGASRQVANFRPQGSRVRPIRTWR